MGTDRPANLQSLNYEDLFLVFDLVRCDNREQLSRGHDLRDLVRSGEMADVAGNKISGFRRLRAFEEPVVGFVRGHGELLGWSNVERERGKVAE